MHRRDVSLTIALSASMLAHGYVAYLVIDAYAEREAWRLASFDRPMWVGGDTEALLPVGLWMASADARDTAVGDHEGSPAVLPEPDSVVEPPSLLAAHRETRLPTSPPPPAPAPPPPPPFRPPMGDDRGGGTAIGRVEGERPQEAFLADQDQPALSREPGGSGRVAAEGMPGSPASTAGANAVVPGEPGEAAANAKADAARPAPGLSRSSEERTPGDGGAEGYLKTNRGPIAAEREDPSAEPRVPATPPPLLGAADGSLSPDAPRLRPAQPTGRENHRPDTTRPQANPLPTALPNEALSDRPMVEAPPRRPQANAASSDQRAENPSAGDAVRPTPPASGMTPNETPMLAAGGLSEQPPEARAHREAAPGQSRSGPVGGSEPPAVANPAVASGSEAPDASMKGEASSDGREAQAADARPAPPAPGTSSSHPGGFVDAGATTGTPAEDSRAAPATSGASTGARASGSRITAGAGVASGAAGRGDGTPPGGPRSDRDADPFSRAGSISFSPGRVDARLGRQVRWVRPRLTLAGQIDAATSRQAAVGMAVSIDASGRVVNVRVLESSGFPDTIDLPVVRAVYSWWFEPLKDESGVPKPDVVLLRVVIRG